MAKLVFHVGMPKTGTTSIQAFLSTYSEQLLRLGIDYPNPEHPDTVNSGVCTGNLLAEIIKAAKSKDLRYEDINKAITSCFEEVVQKAVVSRKAETLLFSGEFLSARCVESNIRVMKRLGIDHQVEIKLFIRDPYDHFISAWKQNVKRGTAAYPHEVFQKGKGESTFVYRRILRFLEPGLRVQLLKFESCRSNLIEIFLSTLGIESKLLKPLLAGKRHNASLSFEQALLVVMTTRLLKNSRMSALLTKQFLENPRPDGDIYLVALDSALRSASLEDLMTINSHLPEKDRYPLAPRTSGPQQPLSFQAKDIEILMRCLAISEPKKNLAITPNQDTSRDLPPDFDPEDYLLRNPDVRRSGMSPVDHYLIHGRYEGRRYKATSFDGGVDISQIRP